LRESMTDVLSVTEIPLSSGTIVSLIHPVTSTLA
jgi:hypothetical protein